LSRRGKQKAFAGILANPPHTTREIMEPNSYLAGERIQPLPVPDFAQLMKNYQKFDVGSMGEFDVALLLDEYTGPDTSKALYPNWRGGYYYAAKPKGDPTSPLAIVYVSQWASAESAQKFAGIYAGSLKKRYRSVQAVARNSDRDPPAGLTQAVDNDGEWLTEEGEVVIDAEGGTVFITESVDEVTSRKLRNAVLNRSQTSPSMGLENFQVAPLCSSVLSAVNAFSFLSPPSPMARNDRPSPLR
jgi:hypothetical protein